MITDVPVARRRNATSIAADRGAPVLDVVIPVYNEESDLAESVRRLRGHLRTEFPWDFRITIADNASIDGTPVIAAELAEQLPEVEVVRMELKGRGRALHHVWSASDAAVLAYMDVDLSTDLAALTPLIAPLVSGHSDLSIGTRLGPGSRVTRGAKREVISRCYNLLLRSTLATRFTDAQCGFKAIRADVAAGLLPHVEDSGWFFDTELLVLAERSGLRIHEVPVDWIDDLDSRVDIIATAAADIRGIMRLVKGFGTGQIPIQAMVAQFGDQAGKPRSLLSQVVQFGAIGIFSTLAYLALFMLLRPTGAQCANLVALLSTAVVNIAANRRFTFGVRGTVRFARHQFEGLIVFAIGLALTSGALVALHSFVEPAPTVELLVLVVANLAASVVRFVLLRGWVFHPRRTDSPRGTV